MSNLCKKKNCQYCQTFIILTKILRSKDITLPMHAT